MTMMTEALRLAAQGWAVLPCQPTGDNAKAPIGSRGFVPRGLLDASTDPKTITRWWKARPDAMIGAVVPVDHIVIDIDPYHGGARSTVETSIGRRLPRTLTTVSGRDDGGTHHYYRVLAGQELVDRLTSVRLPAGVDLRKGLRNYCLMAPSIHPVTGKPYFWLPAPVEVAPVELVALLQPVERAPWNGPAISDKRVARWLEMVATAVEGDRNDLLFWVACSATEAGAIGTHRAAIESAAISSGLPEREVIATIRRAEARCTRRA